MKTIILIQQSRVYKITVDVHCHNNGSIDRHRDIFHLIGNQGKNRIYLDLINNFLVVVVVAVVVVVVAYYGHCSYVVAVVAVVVIVVVVNYSHLEYPNLSKKLIYSTIRIFNDRIKIIDRKYYDIKKNTIKK